MRSARSERSGGPPDGAPGTAPTSLEDLLAILSSPESDARQRAKAAAAMMPVLAARARRAGFRAVAAGRWLADEVLVVAPGLSHRDAPALRRQYPALTDSEIARQLVTNASRTTAAIGAAVGGLAAVEFAAPPALLAAPVQLFAETVAVTAVELRLLAELHQIMGRPVAGTAAEQAGSYLVSWMRRRAVTESAAGVGLGGLLGSATKKELRSHLMRRAGRSATSLAPFFAGAVAGAEINRRLTKDLGSKILAELEGARGERWFKRL